MKSIDWLYHRKNCETCARAQDFFARNRIQAKQTVDARKERLGPAAALSMAQKMEDIYATRGKKVIHFNMRQDKPDEETIASVIIGPSGNLRAPALVLEKTLIIGFDEDTYRKLLK